MKRLEILWKFGLGILILIILIYKVGWTDISQTLLKTNLIYVPFTVLTFFISFALGTLAFLYLFKGLNLKISYKKLYKYYMISWAYGKFLPGKIGEFSLVYFLKKDNFSIEKSSVIVLADKIISFIVLLIMAAFGFFIFFPLNTALKLLGLLVILFLVFLWFLLSKKGRNLIIRFILRKYTKYFKGFSKDIKILFKNKKVILINFILTIIKWGVVFITFYLIFLSFDKIIPLYVILIVAAASTIGSLIPISIGGLGVKDSIGVGLFYKYGITTALSTSVFIVQNIVVYILAFIIITVNFLKRK